MNTVKHSSIDLNWLYRKSKQTTLPKLVYIDEHSEYGGFYVEPNYYPFIYQGKEFQADKGILFVVADDTYRSTMAHEWRHHWQKLNGWNLDYDEFDYDFTGQYKSYKSEIVRYFTENKHEMDALLFEVKHTPNYVNLEWFRWIKESQHE
jgi:hypothetical protein